MRKWRPTYKCIYVVSEIHGNLDALEILLNRILPLRTHVNQEDIVIFLGDYIDGDEKSAGVISKLIDVKRECGDRAIFLRGNHEDLMLKAIGGSEHTWNDWMRCGGQTTVLSYTQSEKASKSQLTNIIPKEHIDFLNSLENFYVIDNYFFMHGSFDPNKVISENNIYNFIYDQSASRYVKDCVKQGKEPEFQNDYIYVAAHNFNGKRPFIHSKYFMIGGGAPKKIFALELNSMDMVQATKGKQRIYKYRFSAC